MASGDIESHLSMIAAASGSVARLRFFLIGHRHHAKCEYFVDLGGVVESTLALFGDLRVVVENDRRDQQQVAFARSPGEHREAAVLDEARRCVRRGIRRFEQ
jgi:cob(I)alamin adenosyltransferase